MPSRVLLTLISSVFFLALAGCQSAATKPVNLADAKAPELEVAPTNSDVLDQSYWRVKTLVGRDVTKLVNATVAFSDHKISGHAGCNLFFADYTVSGEKLSVDLIKTSKKICFSNVMHQELLLLKSLADAERFDKDSEGNLRIFTRSMKKPVLLQPIERSEMPVLAVRD